MLLDRIGQSSVMIHRNFGRDDVPHLLSTLDLGVDQPSTLFGFISDLIPDQISR